MADSGTVVEQEPRDQRCAGLNPIIQPYVNVTRESGWSWSEADGTNDQFTPGQLWLQL